MLLVIVDTLSMARQGGGMAENDNDAMSGAVAALRGVVMAANAHGMFIHHEGKDKSKGMRGGSALEGAVDTAMQLEGSVLRVTKQRDYDRGEEMEVEMIDVTLPAEKGGATSRVAVVRRGLGTAAPACSDKRSKKQREAEAETARFKNMILDMMRKIGGPKEKIRHSALTDAIKATGQFDLDEKGNIRAADRKRLHVGKKALMGSELGMSDAFVWRLNP